MNRQLQRSKVRNEWVIWEKGSWREQGEEEGMKIFPSVALVPT